MATYPRTMKVRTFHGDGTKVLLSYNTPVAAYTRAAGYMRCAEKYSRTTTRHINRWLLDEGAETCKVVAQKHIEALHYSTGNH
jgi:hypothetical protein